MTTICKNWKSVKWYYGIVWNSATITQILLGDCVLNFVQYGACLHLSVQNVWGAHFFLDTLYICHRHILFIINYSISVIGYECTVVLHYTMKEGCHWQAGVENCPTYDSWPIQPDIVNPPILRLTSRKPLYVAGDIKSRWRRNWKSAQMVNSHLVCYPTIREPSSATVVSSEPFSQFARNRDTGACRRKWWLTDIDEIPETHTRRRLNYCIFYCTHILLGQF